MSKNMIVDGHTIALSKIGDHDFISLTDMAKDFGGNDQIKNWIRTRNTIEFLGTWEAMNNTEFNMVGFHHVRLEMISERFIISPTQWIERTNAKGIIAKSGRYGGGTIAHTDIAFEFGSWLSPKFRLYLYTEFQRLKKIETNTYNLEWNVKRILSSTNYKLHTDAIKTHVIPKLNIAKDKEWIVYANEADLLNVAIFGYTAKQWKEANPELANSNSNPRDFASINELTVLSSLESLHSMLISQGVDKERRFNILKDLAKGQLEKLKEIDLLKAVKRRNATTYLDEKIEPTPLPLNVNIEKSPLSGKVKSTTRKGLPPKSK